MNPPKAVLFDAGNTLLFIDPGCVLPIFRGLGIEVSERLFFKAEKAARFRLSQVVEEGGTGTEPHIWKEYFSTLFAECGIPDARLEEVGNRVGEAHRQKHLWRWVDPRTGPALQALKDRGYRLGVISNADGRMEGLIKDAGLRAFFEFVLDSARVGLEKPDPAIFLRAAALLSLEPEEILYVGDLYPADVEGARRAGMEAILLDPWDALERPVPRIPDVAALPEYLARVSSRP